jgi:hypothetical protein
MGFQVIKLYTMDDDVFIDSGLPENLEKATGKIMEMYASRIAMGIEHLVAVEELSSIFEIDSKRFDHFIQKHKAEYFKERFRELKEEAEISREGLSQFWNGYCPESLLNGKYVRMRLNDWDFYESEATGLQIALLGMQAIILKFRGKGKFRATVTYGDENENGEMLSPQTRDRQPFNDGVVFQDSSEIEAYINDIPK